jgi:hypothetical protein
MYLLLFALSAGLNILLGLKAWPAVLGGSLNDPDSYMRLLRIEQGIHAGHLLTNVARDDSGAGVMVEWSRLLDIILWVMAAPMAAFIGWHRALFIAGAMLGPLGVGALGAVLAWVVEPFAARRYLWTAAVAAAILPGLLTFAAPGVVHYHILLLVLIAATAGLVARAWMDDTWPAFLAGLSGGFAIWLTPETMPFILMCFAALMLRWTQWRMGGTLTACAAGFFDVLGFALFIDPPAGGYGVPEIDRLSYVYLVLALLLLAGTAGLWWMETHMKRYRVPAGLALMAVVLGIWVAAFPHVAMGPYGIMSPDEMHKFFGVMLELQPVHGASAVAYLAPGALALAFALAQARQARGRLLWLYVAACSAVALVLGQRFILFVGFSAGIGAALLPMAMSEVSLRLDAKPMLAMLARLAVLAAVLGVPELAGLAPVHAAPGESGHYPSCSLRHIGPFLAPEAGKIVLTQAEDTPELLYRTQVDTVGSLYQHGVPAYLRQRDAWRAVPGAAEPPAVLATGAAYVLFCPQAGRYTPVADLPKTTLWDALEAGRPPAWLAPAGSGPDGWVLYSVIQKN